MATVSGIDAKDRPWFILSRWQEYEGEGRTNLLRVLAIAAYYAVHLVTYLSQAEPTDDDRTFHRLATLIAAAWLFLALAILVSLQRRYLPAALKYASTGMDLLLLTALAWLGRGPQSPLVLGYFVIIAAAALRFSLPLVWISTVGAMAGYMVLVGGNDATWFDPVHDTPVAQQLTTLLSLGLSGMVLCQVLRRFRRAAEQYASGFGASAQGGSSA